MSDPLKAEHLDEALVALRAELTPTIGERSSEVLIQGALMTHAVVSLLAVVQAPGISQARKLQSIAGNLAQMVESLHAMTLTAVCPEAEVRAIMTQDELAALVEKHSVLLAQVMTRITEAMQADEASIRSSIIVPGGLH